MAEQRKQYKVSTVTSTTGITLIPAVGERGANAENMPSTIELTYTASPEILRPVGTVIEIQLEKK